MINSSDSRLFTGLSVGDKNLYRYEAEVEVVLIEHCANKLVSNALTISINVRC